MLYRLGSEAAVRRSCSNPDGVAYRSYAPLRRSTPLGEDMPRSTETAASAAPKLWPPRKGGIGDFGSSAAITPRAASQAWCSSARMSSARTSASAW